ncbi:MAG: RidA family protein [Lachnospiraceae bacterium]|nr:RidA family protein [Lachnospiraceae bacterium]
MNTISTPNAPAAIGPYSQAKVVGNLMFASGQIPLDPVTGNVVGEDITAQTQQILKNIDGLLKAVGCGPENVVKTTCFLKNIADFAVFNTIYGEYFTSKPARSCVEVSALPKNVLVEVEIIAVLN